MPGERHQVDFAGLDASVTVILPSEWALRDTKSGTDSSPSVRASRHVLVTNRFHVIFFSLVGNVRHNSWLFDAVPMDIWLVQNEKLRVVGAASHAGAAAVTSVVFWAGSGHEWEFLAFGHRILRESGLIVGNGGALAVDGLASFVGSFEIQTTSLDVISVGLTKVVVLKQQSVHVNALLDALMKGLGPVDSLSLNSGISINFVENRKQAGKLVVGSLADQKSVQNWHVLATWRGLTDGRGEKNA